MLGAKFGPNFRQKDRELHIRLRRDVYTDAYLYLYLDLYLDLGPLLHRALFA